MAPMHNPDPGIRESKSSALTTAPASAATSAVSPSPSAAAATSPALAPAGRRWKVSEVILLSLLLVLAFFLTSFAVANADFWMHLATGRLIANGAYVFGVDPFSYMTEGVAWINQSWLYDLGLYGLYQSIGGEGLVIVKGLIVVALVLVLFQLRRRDFGWTLPVAVLTLTVLTMSPRLFFHPMILSYLFLGITIYVLYTAGQVSEVCKTSEASSGPCIAWRRLWILPPLFVLWVNVDAWFILGPLTVAVFLLGAWMQQRRGDATGAPPRTLAAVLGAGLLACLLNPHHVLAFQLPSELAYPVVQAADLVGLPLPETFVAGGRTLQRVRPFMGDSFPIFSPFQLSHLNGIWRDKTIDDWCYFILLALSLFSFVLLTPLGRRVGVFPWGRCLVYGFFALLSLFQTRLIGFFAIVAGATALVNIQSFWLAATAERGASPVRWFRLGGFVTGVGLASLLFLAWPGWLRPVEQPGANRTEAQKEVQPRRVAWSLQPDASYVATAAALDRLHAEDGALHGTEGRVLKRGFNYHPDLVPYCAWFCQQRPRIRWFYDSRWPLFAGQVAEYARIREILAREGRTLSSEDRNAWSKAAQAHELTYIVVPIPRTEPSTYGRWRDPSHWPLLYLNGRATISGWNESGQPGVFAGLARDFSREAFADPRESAHLAGQGPPPPQGLWYWGSYAEGPPPRPLALDDIDAYQAYRELSTRAAEPTRLLAWTSVLPAMSVGVAPANVTAPAFLTGLWLVNEQRRAALAVLIFRRARQALAEAPEHPQGYRHFLAALEILKGQEDFFEPASFKEPGGITRNAVRQIQLVTALHNDVVVNPFDAGAHWRLAQMYLQLDCVDAAREQLALSVQYLEQNPPSAKRDQWSKDVEGGKKLLAQWDEDLKKRQRAFEIQSVGDSPLQRARKAYAGEYRVDDAKSNKSKPLGLTLLALEILQNASASQFANEDERKQADVLTLRLQLLLGWAAEARDNLKRLRDLGVPLHDLEVQAAAAVGDYDDADRTLAEMEASLRSYVPGLERVVAQVATHEVGAALSGGPAGVLAPLIIPQRTPLDFSLLHRAAGVTLLRGLFALERGDSADAARHFQNTLDLMGTRLYSPDTAIARAYLQFLRAQQP